MEYSTFELCYSFIEPFKLLIVDLSFNLYLPRDKIRLTENSPILRFEFHIFEFTTQCRYSVTKLVIWLYGWRVADYMIENARCSFKQCGFRPMLLPATSVNRPGSSHLNELLGICFQTCTRPTTYSDEQLYYFMARAIRLTAWPLTGQYNSLG